MRVAVKRRAMRKATAVRASLISVLICLVTSFASADYYDGLRAYDAGKYVDSFAYWAPAANAGDPKSQFRLAKLYEGGLGSPLSIGGLKGKAKLIKYKFREKAYSIRRTASKSQYEQRGLTGEITLKSKIDSK